MKLSTSTIYALERFLSGNAFASYYKDGYFYRGDNTKVYNLRKFPNFIPIGCYSNELIPKSGSNCIVEFTDNSNDYIFSPRSSQPLIRELLNGRPCKDTNGVLYKTAPGIIADENCMPLIMVLISRGTVVLEKKVVINSYVLRKPNIISKVILDTIVPILVENKYKEELVNNGYSYSRIVRCPVQIEDLSNVWIDKFPTFGLSKDMIRAAKYSFFIG